MASVRASHRTRAAAVVAALAGAVLMVAAVALPWATYRGSTAITYRGGTLGAVVAVGSVVAIAVAVVMWFAPSRVGFAIITVLAVALGLAAAEHALASISAANHVGRLGPGETAYAYGSGTALIAAGAMAVAGGFGFGLLAEPPPPPVADPPQEI